MLRVLIPVDGSENAERAVKLVVRKAQLYKEPLEIHLLNVQHPFPGTIRGVHHQAEQAHREEGMKALAGAFRQFDNAGIKYKYHIGVGEVPETIAHFAREQQVEQIVMGVRGLGTVAGLLLGSVTTKVLHLVEVPVLLVK